MSFNGGSKLFGVALAAVVVIGGIVFAWGAADEQLTQQGRRIERIEQKIDVLIHVGVKMENREARVKRLENTVRRISESQGRLDRVTVALEIVAETLKNRQKEIGDETD